MNIPSNVEAKILSRLEKARYYKESIKACCPFHHEKTPSFTVGEKDGVILFHCFGCGESGTINKLLRHLDIDFRINYASKKSTFLYEVVDKTPSVRRDLSASYSFFDDYFLYRGISKSIIKKFNFRFRFHNPAAVLPVYTKKLFKGFIYRNLTPGMTKYEIQEDMAIKESLWGFDACDKTRPTVITEGIIDAAVLWSHGIQSVALIGKNWQDKLDLIKEFKKLYCMYDNGDIHSFNSFDRLRRSVCGSFFLVPPRYKDIGEMAQENPSELKNYLLDQKHLKT